MRNELVLKAHIERNVRGRGEGLASLAGDVLRTAVVVAKSILDLYHITPLALSFQLRPMASSERHGKTYVHVDHLTIAPIPIYNRRHHNQLILQHKVPYAAFILRAVARDSGEIESERRCQLHEDEEGEEWAEE